MTRVLGCRLAEPYHQFEGYYATFRNILFPKSSGYFEVGDGRFLLNIDHFLPDSTASHLKEEKHSNRLVSAVVAIKWLIMILICKTGVYGIVVNR
jgi:hypothetical protein